MGGCSYDREVYTSSDSFSNSSFSYSTRSEKVFAEVKKAAEIAPLDTSLFPLSRDLVCSAQTGVAVVLDVTGSMGDSAKVVYDKLPMFYGQIEQQGYLDDFALSFAAVGDVDSDRAPLQVCDFDKGIALDDKVNKLYLEGEGGPSWKESYEMMAYYYSRHVDFIHPEKRKPFLFFIGDEGFKDRILGGTTQKHFGESAVLSGKEAINELSQKYHVFMIHIPYSSVKVSGAADKVESNNPSVEKNVCEQWSAVLGDRFISLDEPKAIVDVMLGCIAITTGRRTLAEYDNDMEIRLQTKSRRESVLEALKVVQAIPEVDTPAVEELIVETIIEPSATDAASPKKSRQEARRKKIAAKNKDGTDSNFLIS